MDRGNGQIVERKWLAGAWYGVHQYKV
jgi:hypothetical protein